jgi:hypothetical protein
LDKEVKAELKTLYDLGYTKEALDIENSKFD